MQDQLKSRARPTILLGTACVLLCVAQAVWAQAAPAAEPQPAPPPAGVEAGPIAIVPIDTSGGDQAATVSGALRVSGGRAIIAASGSVTSGSKTTDVVLPHRGELRVCASTTVKLAADSSVLAGETPGLLMAMDQGAVEMSFANLRNADILLTPNFRILIGGQGASEVKVRLGSEGDTCVDNSGANAPYVVVTSVFESGLYRVQPGQRVMFQHGSLREVVDQEKEPCGCPPAPVEAKGNEFPLAESEGLTPNPPPAAKPAEGAAAAGALVYSGAEHAQQTVAIPPPSNTPAAAPANPPANPQATKKKPGFFGKVGQFFRRIFGAE
jgi:hypothetical protein